KDSISVDHDSKVRGRDRRGCPLEEIYTPLEFLAIGLAGVRLLVFDTGSYSTMLCFEQRLDIVSLSFLNTGEEK
ncbi:MAG: hypothetical protein OXT67_04025, partial [Zetaproteobacteria bacterium]|nr:hypothetical protein [Zetaproteobacteria bacterium]